MQFLHHGRTAARADAFALSTLKARVASVTAALLMLGACAVPGSPEAAPTAAPSAAGTASRAAPNPAWPAATDADRAALAPTGVLRIAVYPGSPTSLVKAGDERGVTVELDAFATNKAILHELADSVPGARVLDGRWGLEQMALAVPRGREAGHAWLARFTATARERGLVTDAARRAGLRGLATDTP